MGIRAGLTAGVVATVLGAALIGPPGIAAAVTCSTSRITNTAAESADPDISDDGSTLVFRSQADLSGDNGDGSSEVFRLRDGTMEQVSVPNSNSYTSSISRTGGVVALESQGNLGGTNPAMQTNIFRWNGSSFINTTDITTVSLLTGNPSINNAGNAIAFRSQANLTGSNAEGNTELFRWSLFGPPNLVQLTNGGAGALEINGIDSNAAGDRIVFQTQRNIGGGNPDGQADVFLWDSDDGIDQITNAQSGFGAGGATINDDGDVIVFDSSFNIGGMNPESNSEVWRWTEEDGIEPVTEVASGERSSRSADVDGTGNRVSFFSTADLTGGNADGSTELFRWDAASDSFTQLTSGNATFPGFFDDPAVDAVGARTAFTTGSALPGLGGNGNGLNEIYRTTCRTFDDVPASSPFFDDIEWMAAEGISTGFQGGTVYRPTESVTRQAMSAFMYRLAGEPFFPPPPFATFEDVPNTHPFYAEIEWMAFLGITTGFPDDTFRPTEPVKRQSMSAFMYRLAGEPTFDAPDTPTFSDVPLTHPFYDEIEWMADEDITTGFSGGVYRPDQDVSRQAMSAFMRRLAEGPGVDVGP